MGKEFEPALTAAYEAVLVSLIMGAVPWATVRVETDAGEKVSTLKADGSEQEIGAGDMYVIRPGHDASIVGDETFVGVDFSSDIERFAKEQ